MEGLETVHTDTAPAAIGPYCQGIKASGGGSEAWASQGLDGTWERASWSVIPRTGWPQMDIPRSGIQILIR